MKNIMKALRKKPDKRKEQVGFTEVYDVRAGERRDKVLRD